MFYDFNDPDNLPTHLFGTFQMIVMDPPFINKAVWEKMYTTARVLLGIDPKEQEINDRFILATTVAENCNVLLDMFGAKPMTFSPSIPNLVYQYLTFANFASPWLDQVNEEIVS